MNSYRAHAFAPQTGARLQTGTIRVESGYLVFESPELNGKLPIQNIIIRRGGHNDEQIFFEHAEFPGWSLYSSDPALLSDPVLSADKHFQNLARGVSKSRKSIPFP